jgi:hypothetical protein
MSVALVTIRYQPTVAAPFWHKACHKVGFEEGELEMVLSTWLERNRPVHFSKLDYARYVASAWNGHVDEKGNVKTADKSRSRLNRGRGGPFTLHGTPFKGTHELWFIGDDGQPLHDPIARRRQGYIRSLLEPATA